jgi:hypothetical protein
VRVEADITTAHTIADKIARLLGQDVCRVAVLAIVDVAKDDHWRPGPLHLLG